MSTVNGFQVGSETLKYNYESLDNYNTPNFSTSSSTAYAVGDYVMYNGKLYKCTTATTGGTWVSNNWAEAVLSDDVSDLTHQLSDLETSENINGDLCILVPNDALSTATIISVGSSITGIKTTGKNLYPYGNIPRYDYGFYVSSLADAKARGIRLPKGTYTLAYTSSITNSRLQIRAWTDDGTLLTDNTKFKASYERNSLIYKEFYWQTYRFASAQWSTSPILSIEVYDEGIWFLFCEDGASNYGDVTDVMLTPEWDAPETYVAYTSATYDADVTQINVTSNGMIVFAASDMADTATSVRFSFPRNDWAKVIAEAFDTSESGYSVGDYCIYNSKLWKCNTAQVQGSAFYVNNWTEICVMDEVKTLNVNIANLNDNVSNPFMMPFMQSGKPKLFAHAGFKSESAPENTIPAFIAAGEKGYFGIETDVNETSDGYFVMIHDTTLDRTTNGTGLVNEKTLAEIRALHIKDHDDLQVPTLDEYLGICKMYGCAPSLEIKSSVAHVDNLIETVEKFGFANQCIYSGSFYTDIFAWQRKTNMPFYSVYQNGALADIEQAIVNLMDVYHCTNMGVAVEGINVLSKATIEKCHANNIFTICFVLDDKASVQQAFEKGYDFVTTNCVYLP